MRSIHITVKYYNGKTTCAGIYNPVNAEYTKSKLSYDGLISCIAALEMETKGRKLKSIKVVNSISTGNSNDLWETCIHHYNKLIDIPACKLVDINHVLFPAFLKEPDSVLDGEPTKYLKGKNIK